MDENKQIDDTGRDFKGIWIPKEIWTNKELTTMEKLFYVEIDSLDNQDGCYASNNYFSDFFGITRQRCSQIIKSLEAKKHIKIQYERQGREITKRTIRVSNLFYTVSNKCEDGSKKISTRCQENVKENNIYNNTMNNINKERFKKLKSFFDEKYQRYHNSKITNWSKETTQLKNILKYDDELIKKKISIFESNIVNKPTVFWEQIAFLPSTFIGMWDKLIFLNNEKNPTQEEIEKLREEKNRQRAMLFGKNNEKND